MRNAYDPWGRRAAARTVPLDTALALRDEAQRAQARAEQAEARLAQVERRAARVSAESAALRDELAVVKADLGAVLVEAEPEPAPAALRAVDDEELASLEAQLAELRADLANVRRHRDEAVQRARGEGREQALLTVADSLDDLDRALTDVSDPTVAEGLRALRDRMERRLAEAGVHRFTHPGDRFDPTRHEAIGLGDGPEGEVIALERRGLQRLDGAVIRPALAVVGSGRTA